MEANDRKAFIEVVIGFAEMKGKQLSAPALELYWEAMKSWPIDEFKAAASYLLKTSEFMPTPYNFEELRKAGRPTAGEAWAMVLQHAKGKWRQGVIGEPLVDKAVRILGGYQAIAMCDTSKLGFLERRFCEHYDALEGVGDIRDAVPELTSDRDALRRLTDKLNGNGKLLGISRDTETGVEHESR